MRSPGRVSSPGMDRNAAFLQFKAGAGQQLNQVGSANAAHRGVTHAHRAAKRLYAALHVPDGWGSSVCGGLLVVMASDCWATWQLDRFQPSSGNMSYRVQECSTCSKGM